MGHEEEVMGKLIEGKWIKGSILSRNKKGKFLRSSRTFHDTISEDNPKYRPEKNRYHLYVSYACPWAHRTLLYRHLKELDDIITVDVVHPDMMEMGWSFSKNFPGCTGDSIFGKDYLHQVYQEVQSDISTTATVPILFDKKSKTIVNNESSEIIRILNKSFNKLTGNQKDFYPEKLSAEIDQLNELIYKTVNNGVYQAGFATSQKAYEQATNALFNTLDELEQRLERQTFLLGEAMTEADLRLIPTLVRFDHVYYIHFKCSKRKISEYPNLSRYLKRFQKMTALKSTTHIDHIIRHYYYSHESINPQRIIPILF